MMKCVLCGSKKYKKLFSKDGYDIKKCEGCGLVKTQGGGDVGYDNYHRDNEYEASSEVFKNLFSKRYKIINKFKNKPGKVLDIGASSGGMLEVFFENGWDVLGVEPSKKATKLANEKGFKVINKPFEEVTIKDESIDVVILNHTLEHVKNPVRVLKKVKKILKNNGIVYVDVPNFGSLSSTLLRENWPYLLPEEHTYQFTEATLRKTFRKAGFEVVWSRSWSGIFDYANPAYELWHSLTSLKKRFFYDIFGLPGALVSTILDRGSSLAVVGRKS